jgi:hypothetical protein
MDETKTVTTTEKKEIVRLRKLAAFQKRCKHDGGHHWQDTYGNKCHMQRDFKKARTWHCDLCFALLPFGQSLNPYAEQLAFDFLLGKFNHLTGGFPSVAFHDGYRQYDERVEAWLERSRALDGESAASKIEEWLDDYAAGALALELENEWP